MDCSQCQTQGGGEGEGVGGGGVGGVAYSSTPGGQTGMNSQTG